MATLISPDGKIRIPTDNPTEIVRLKAQGFSVKEAPAKKPNTSTKPAESQSTGAKPTGN